MKKLLPVLASLFGVLVFMSCPSPIGPSPAAVEYTVTFDSQDATKAADPASLVFVSPDTTVKNLPAPPEKTSHNFGGWYTKPNGGGTAFKVGTIVRTNSTVYAKWNDSSFTVSFDSQSATVAADPVSLTVNLPDTTVGTLPTPPVKTGYVFAGWYTEASGKGTEFTATTVVSADCTVYAKWDSYSYTVTFDGQGDTVEPVPAKKTVSSPDVTVGTLPAPPAKSGFAFAGWYTEKNGGGTAFTSSTVVSKDLTVYASWSANPVYTVSFDSNGGSEVGDLFVTLPATSVELLPEPPAKAGYIFGGWFTEKDGGGSEFTADTEVSANITVFAKWNSYSYTVTFNGEGATTAADPASLQVASPSLTVAALPSQPKKTGYLFGGWFTGSAGGGTEFAADTTVSADVTVHAYWIAYSYTVSFDDQGATSTVYPASKTVASPTVTIGSLPSEPEKTGYIFGGWWTEPDGAGSAFTAATIVTGSIEVYARWDSYAYVVTFSSPTADTPAGLPSATVSSPALCLGTFPEPPTRTGYVFGGWNTEPEGAGSSFFATTGVTADITVHAEWWQDFSSPKIGNMIAILGGSYQRDATATNVTTVSSFSMSAHEITQAQYVAVTGKANPSSDKTGTDAPDRAVDSVSWYDALVFCNMLSMAEGKVPVYSILQNNEFETDPAKWGTVPTGNEIMWNYALIDKNANGYRMPTEAEWVWAAMGASKGSGYVSGVYTTGYLKEFAGDPNPETTGASPLAYAWYMGNLTNYRPHAVGGKTQNELGLYDMSGNVAEWCYDYSAAYPVGAQLDPANNKTAITRILRGGSWYSSADNLKLTYRDDDYFAYGAYAESGLRVVCRP